MTVVHDEEHIKATMTQLNSIFPPDSNQPTRSTVVTPSCAATIPPSINPLAFHSNPATGSPVKPTYAAIKKFRSIAILNKAINEMGNSEQAALAMSTLLQTKQKDVGQLMAIAAPEGTKAQVAMGIMESIAKVLARTDCLGSSSNDAISFQETVLFAIVPPAPGEVAAAAVKKAHQRNLNSITSLLGIKSKSVKDRVIKVSLKRRDLSVPLEDG
jgi:hypothetical protein